MNVKVYKELDLLINHYPELKGCEQDIVSAFDLLVNCYQSNGFVLICGNGGSAADSSHIVGELMKGFKKKRQITIEQRNRIMSIYPQEGALLADRLQRALPAISLVDQSALSSAICNDISPEMIYAQQVFGYGKEGDVLIALSTSGNSLNVINACKIAKAFGIRTIALTGENGGNLGKICDIVIRAPATDVYRVQEYHLPIYHTICSMLEIEFMA